MNAPATPGPGDSGSAAGSDSEQGSGANESGEEANSFEVTSLYYKLDSTTGPISEETTNRLQSLNRSENMGIEMQGTNLDRINTAVLVYSDGYTATNLNLTRVDGSTDTHAIFSTQEFPKNDKFYIDGVILNGEFIVDKRESEKKVYISAYVNSNTMGRVSGSGLVTFGTEVTLVANASSGYHFVGWEDGNTEANRTFVADAPYQFRALFAPDEDGEFSNLYKLTLSVDDETHGSVTPAGGIYYSQNAEAHIKATSAPNYVFSNWSDGSTEASRSITMRADISLVAYFSLAS